MKRRTPRFLSRLTYANLMATFAVFMVLGGSAYAAGAIITNSKQIGKHVVASRNLKNGAVKLNNLSSAARTALKGDQGDPGTPGAPGASVFDSAIPSGTTVTGAWGGRYIAPQLAFNNSYLLSSSFPVKAPASLTDAQVNVAPNTAAGDPDPTCTGSVDNPTAPAGKVCVYIGSSNNATVTGFKLVSPGTGGTQPGDAYGFIVRMIDKGTVGNTATMAAEGTWAYTAS
jgi:hypothetical protein